MNPATASEKGLAEVIHSEAIVTGPYYDSVGVLTDGIGHTKAAGGHDPASRPLGTVLSLEEILEAYRQDIRTYESRTARAMIGPTEQHQFDAGFSFDLNTGAINRAQWVKSHNSGDYAQAAAEIMNWVKPPELRNRRLREQKLYQHGIYSSGGKALLVPASILGKPLYSQAKEINVIPAIQSLRLANKSDSVADSAKKKAQGSLAATAATTATATPTPVAPDVTTQDVINAIPNGKLLLAIIILAAIGFVVYFTMKMRGERELAKNLTARAAEQITASAVPVKQQGESNGAAI